MVRDSAPLKRDCNEQDRWRRRLDNDDLEGKDQARVTGKVLGGEIIRYGEGETLEGDSHLFRRRGLPCTESPIVAISGARNEWFVIALL